MKYTIGNWFKNYLLYMITKIRLHYVLVDSIILQLIIIILQLRVINTCKLLALIKYIRYKLTNYVKPN